MPQTSTRVHAARHRIRRHCEQLCEMIWSTSERALERPFDAVVEQRGRGHD
jgi:hypothetical protein